MKTKNLKFILDMFSQGKIDTQEAIELIEELFSDNLLLPSVPIRYPNPTTDHIEVTY